VNATEPTTSELVRQCLAGQQTAWEALLSRYERLIYYTALKSGLTNDAAADVFQTVCMIWLEELGRLRDPERLGAWLVTTTRRECWARLRRDHLVVEDDLDTLMERAAAADESPEALAAQAEDAQAVRLALQQLPEPCRSLLQLFFYDPDHLSYSDIASRLNISVNSLGPTRTRCLDRLREILRQAGW
jgi:RNA polymerase sigma factor (sigma-70 family)